MNKQLTIQPDFSFTFIRIRLLNRLPITLSGTYMHSFTFWHAQEWKSWGKLHAWKSVNCPDGNTLILRIIFLNKSIKNHLSNLTCGLSSVHQLTLATHKNAHSNYMIANNGISSFGSSVENILRVLFRFHFSILKFTSTDDINWFDRQWRLN